LQSVEPEPPAKAIYEESHPAYSVAPTSAYQASYQNTSYYPAVQQQHLLAQQAAYHNGAQHQQSYVTNPTALAAAALAYAAKNASSAQYSTASVPAGHYSTAPISNKTAELPDSYVIETESVIQPLHDTWDKDHGKRAKRVHEVIENERGNLI
jgi:hypothetical protein